MGITGLGHPKTSLLHKKQMWHFCAQEKNTHKCLSFWKIDCPLCWLLRSIFFLIWKAHHFDKQMAQGSFWRQSSHLPRHQTKHPCPTSISVSKQLSWQPQSLSPEFKPPGAAGRCMSRKPLDSPVLLSLLGNSSHGNSPPPVEFVSIHRKKFLRA